MGDGVGRLRHRIHDDGTCPGFFSERAAGGVCEKIPEKPRSLPHRRGAALIPGRGTEVLPGERKFTDYAYPPLHQPLDVVTNTGGRVGWHRSPLPGPFDLSGNRNPFGW